MTRPFRVTALSAECALLFFLGPLAYSLVDPGPGWMFPSLWIWALCCVVLLLRDRGFQLRQLWNRAGLRRELRPMLLRFLVLGGLIAAAVALLAPERLLSLPRHNPVLWAVIMVAYPLLSVYPQEVIFRAFFFRRYAPIFGGSTAMFVASAAAFGFVHIIFYNPIAVAMTLVGGLLFSITYARSRSVLAASIEHALYGCLVFTIGIGSYFYTGARERAPEQTALSTPSIPAPDPPPALDPGDDRSPRRSEAASRTRSRG